MSIVTVFVTGDNSSSERRFDKSLTITALKGRLEAIVGVPSTSQQLSLYKGDNFVASFEGQPDGTMIGAFPIEDFMRIHVVNTGAKVSQEFSDVSQVEKFEITEEEYDKRTDSVRAFKIRNKLGRFSDASSNVSTDSDYAEPPSDVKIGARFEADVAGLTQRGAIRYIGFTDFKPGFWVGVEYDEPLGKHDGTVSEKTYFKCRPKHGAFLRPEKLRIGDYPEDLLMSDDELEEM